MFQTSLSDILRIVIISLICLILVFVWTGFVMLDKKINKALNQQGAINERSCKINEEQSKSIRVLQTDVDILTRLTLEGIYTKEEE